LADHPGMELVAARISDEQVEVTLADGTGLIGLTGTPDEIVALCEAMDETALLAGASDQPAWVRTVRVGTDVVRLGIGSGRVRLIVGPAG
jgi:hypothetical protein